MASTKRAAGDEEEPPSPRRPRVTAPAPNSSNPEPGARAYSPCICVCASVLLVLLVCIANMCECSAGLNPPDSARIGRLEMKLGQLRHDLAQVRDTTLQELGQLRHHLRQVHNIFLHQLEQLRQDFGQVHSTLLRSSHGTHKEGTNGEAAGSGGEPETEGKDTVIRLVFYNKIEPPVYHEDEIKTIKLGIFDGDRIIESGPMSKLKIEVLALEGNFPYNPQDSWTSKEFDDHIAYGRDGKGNVLAGKGTNAQLTNGECDLGGIRFRESSCRARSAKFIVAARVRGSQAICGRVQEAVMDPVVVLDRRNKYHEKSHPPKPDEEVYRLEKIAINGKYHKRLKEHNIRTVEHFSKALYKDEDNLARILKIKKKCKDWEKMVHHAQECCLQGKPELKSYRCEQGNVVLFFNYVHRFVGASFGGQYITPDMLDPVQKNLVDKLKKNAYDKLDSLTGDHVMKDKIPVRIPMDTDGGAGPSSMANSARQQINSLHQIAEHQVGGTPACEVLRQCAPHGLNSIPEPNNSTYIYQASSTNIPQNVLSVGDITTVEGWIHGLNVSSFAVANDGPSTSSSVPYLTTQNYQDQGTGFAAQQQQHFPFVDGMPQEAQAFLQHQADNNTWAEAQELHLGEMLQYHVGMSGYDILEASASSYMDTTPQLFINNAGAAYLPNDGTTGSSGSAQQEWSTQCEGNMAGNPPC